MKKIIFAIVFVMTIGLGVNAQNDGFFRSWDNDNWSNRGTDPSFSDIIIPYHFSGTKGDAPLGSGILVLTALGAGYAVYRKKRN